MGGKRDLLYIISAEFAVSEVPETHNIQTGHEIGRKDWLGRRMILVLAGYGTVTFRNRTDETKRPQSRYIQEMTEEGDRR